jgi:hypothetical protein
MKSVSTLLVGAAFALALVSPTDANTMHCCKSWGKANSKCRVDGNGQERLTPDAAGEAVCPDHKWKHGSMTDVEAERKIHDISGDVKCKDGANALDDCSLSKKDEECKAWLSKSVEIDLPDDDPCCVKRVIEGFGWDKNEKGFIDCSPDSHVNALKMGLKKCTGEHTETVVKGHVDSSTDEQRKKHNDHQDFIAKTRVATAAYQRFLRIGKN